MKSPIEFTPREKFVISYYRELKANGDKHVIAYYVAVIVIAGFCYWRFLITEDQAWLFVALALLVYRTLSGLSSHLKYTKAVASIFDKYEAAVKNEAGRTKDENGA